MNKLLLFLAVFLIIFPLVSAANLTIEILDERPLIIKDIENKAKFTLNIINNEKTQDNFEIYSLVGVSISPEDRFSIVKEGSRNLEIEILPHEETRNDFQGLYTFEYQIKGQKTGFFSDRLTIKILELKDVFNIKIEEIALDDEKATILVKNNENFDFEDLGIIIQSDFFDLSETIDLDSNEEIKFTADIKKDNIRSLEAGGYDGQITLRYQGTQSQSSSEINYLEKRGTSSSDETFGLIVTKDIISKTNEGNVKTIVVLEERKNILSRLFTTFSEKPLTSERNGLFVDFTWEKEINPGEEFEVVATTNWTFPVIILIIIILAGVITKALIGSSLTIQKRASFVKTKGGEFALKIRLKVKARSDVENVKIKDRIPRLTKLYGKFGTRPDKIDEQTRSIYWHVRKINKGEERIFTYIIYSKVNIIGRFELPVAIAKFEKNDKTHQVKSNTTSFAREDVQDDEE